MFKDVYNNRKNPNKKLIFSIKYYLSNIIWLGKSNIFLTNTKS